MFSSNTYIIKLSERDKASIRHEFKNIKTSFSHRQITFLNDVFVQSDSETVIALICNSEKHIHKWCDNLAAKCSPEYAGVVMRLKSFMIASHKKYTPVSHKFDVFLNTIGKEFAAQLKDMIFQENIDLDYLYKLPYNELEDAFNQYKKIPFKNYGKGLPEPHLALDYIKRFLLKEKEKHAPVELVIS